MPSQKKILAIQTALLNWYSHNARPLPWRAGYEPYATWIAEIMMQQTQMSRGLIYYERWMQRFPTIAHVAAAPEQELLLAWEGLGYYRRVRNIQAAARQIMQQHNGIFPDEPTAIRALPGIGEYTAAAIASTAFGHDIVSIDGNVERVLCRLFDIDSQPKTMAARKQLYALGTALMPPGRARDCNQALMEFGALQCRKKALCASCPLAEWCESLRLGIVQERPVAGNRSQITHALIVAGVLQKNSTYLVQRRAWDDAVWAGLWEFPGGSVEAGEEPHEAVVREVYEELELRVGVVSQLGLIKHSYTSYRLSLHGFLLSLQPDEAPEPKALNAASEYTWATLEALEQLPMPAAHRKLADGLKALACGA